MAFAIWNELQELGFQESAASLQKELKEEFGSTTGHVIMGQLQLQEGAIQIEKEEEKLQATPIQKNKK